MRKVISIPDAERTFEAIRSLGYDLNSSIADLIDNSISAGGKSIYVDLIHNGNGFTLSVVDNGKGMSSRQLEEAMRVGSRGVYGAKDLGKFGMGMKTASLSHCDRLMVFSRNKRKGLCGYCWDLDYVKDEEGWALQELDQKEISGLIQENPRKLKGTGTIVLWDRFLVLDQEYEAKNSEVRKDNYHYNLIAKLKIHLSLVFHRFLDASFRNALNVSIYVNGDRVAPLDPFCSKEKNSKEIPLGKEAEQFYPLELSGKKPIVIRGYVLPSKEGVKRFSSKQAWEAAKGNFSSWNDSQGYYIYRANRLIRFGGWHKTRAKDEHAKLARVSIDVPKEYDRLFRITVNKALVAFPRSFFLHLKEVINPKITKPATERYRGHRKKPKVNNKFRNSKTKMKRITKELMDANKVSFGKKKTAKGDMVLVKKRNGSYQANSIAELVRLEIGANLNVSSAPLKDKGLWTLVCNPSNQQFTVVINENHPFCEAVYFKEGSKANTALIDAILYTLAFAELYSKKTENAEIFEEIRDTFSRTMDKLIEEKVF